MRPQDATDAPVVPTLDAATKANLQRIFADGTQRGNYADVFAKIGDSITESGSFLSGIGCREEILGNYQQLSDTIDFFRRHTFPASYTSAWCEVANSFNRSSLSAVAGWSADYATAPFTPPLATCPAPNNTPLRCELTLLKPSIALIMYGTNDLDRYNNLAYFRQSLTEIVDEVTAFGTIPVLSTIPPRLDDPQLSQRVGPYNQAILELAQEKNIPLINFWRAMNDPSMVDHGLSDDMAHPNLYGGCHPECQADNFTDEGLRYGYNQRNLLTLLTLDEIRKEIFGEAGMK